jgi:hypothetical protein
MSPSEDQAIQQPTEMQMTTRKTSKQLENSKNWVLSHKVGTLLHTMRSIQQHEQELCTLMHDFERDSSANPEAIEELRHIVSSMPTRDYLDDLSALQESLESV